MLQPKTHVCLVYNTSISNVTPALDPKLKPERVLLVHGTQQKAVAEDLASVLTPTGVQVTFWPLDDTRNVSYIRDQLLNLLAEYDGEDLALNASGGTRPMLMAAYELFQEFGKPVFYVHPETDELTWLHRRDLDGFNVANQIKLPAYLQAHGAPVTSQAGREGVPTKLRALLDILVKHVDQLAKPLAALNWLAQQADSEHLRSPRLSDSQLRWDALTALISAFAEQGLVSLEKGCLQFPDEAARFFVNGGWLEVHTYSLLFNLRSELGTIQDIGRSIEVSRQAGGLPVRNELDVAFLANNRLYIIECKTKRFSHGSASQQVDTPSAEVLYKLDTLKGVLGGTRSEVMLVSYNPLSRWDLQRAQDLQVEVCVAEDLGQLKGRISRWVERTGGAVR